MSINHPLLDRRRLKAAKQNGRLLLGWGPRRWLPTRCQDWKARSTYFVVCSLQWWFPIMSTLLVFPTSTTKIVVTGIKVMYTIMCKYTTARIIPWSHIPIRLPWPRFCSTPTEWELTDDYTKGSPLRKRGSKLNPDFQGTFWGTFIQFEFGHF